MQCAEDQNLNSICIRRIIKCHHLNPMFGIWASHCVMGIPGVRHERLNRYVWDSNITGWGLLGWDPSCGKCVQVLWGPPGWYHKLVYWDRLLFTAIPLKNKWCDPKLLASLPLFYSLNAVALPGDIRLPLFPVDNLSFSQHLSCVTWGSYNYVGHSDLHFFSSVYLRWWGFMTKTIFGVSIVSEFVMLMWESKNCQ